MKRSDDIPEGSFCCRVDLETLEVEFCKYFKDGRGKRTVPVCMLENEEIKDGTKICGRNMD